MMKVLFGVIGSICYICGSSVGIANSTAQFILILKKLNVVERIKDRSFIELIKDDNIEKAIVAFIVLLIFISPIFISFIMISAIYHYTDGSSIRYFVYSACLFGVGIRWTKMWWEDIEIDNQQEKPELTFVPDCRFRDLAVKICTNANTGYLNLYFIDGSSINAYALKDRKGSKCIIFTKSCEVLTDSEIAALVGHEIAHLKNGDLDIIEKLRRIMGFMIMFAIFGINVALLTQLLQLHIVGAILAIIIAPSVIIYEIAMLIFLSIDDKRFWKQIQEIRADRVACTYDGVTQAGMISLLKKLKGENNQKIAWYKKIYMKYFKIMEHPCLDWRIYLMENYRKWSILDYYLHAGQMFKWFITGKGWIGE